MPRITPDVPLHQPDGTRMDASHLPIDADDDPAVFVVRESDVASVNVERHGGKWVADGEAVASVGDEPARARGPIAQYMKWVADAEAVARVIEIAEES